jgi:hydroxymethylpyrimidine pyrophosphatase-like HAD family hydrolase
VQATHPEVSKGHAVLDFKRICGPSVKVIAAGDDNNDLPMLAAADVKVVMGTAPKTVLEVADIIAPPASQEGIIAGLTQAIARIYKTG